MLGTKLVAIVLITLVTLAACAPAAPPAVETPVADPVAEEAAIRAAGSSWFEAYNAGDADRVLALYAADGVVMPPGAPAAAGHAAMRDFLVADIAKSKAAGVTLVDGASSVGVSGDLAWHSGAYTVTNAAGETVDSGGYMEAWRKTDGTWRIVRDIWNSDRPAPAPAP